MAFPQIASISTGSIGSSSTPEALTLPSGTTTGNRLIAIVSFDNDGDPLVIVGTGTGWTKKAQEDGQTIAMCSAVFEKLAADGDDTLTISTTGVSSPSELGTYTVLRITGHDAAETVAPGSAAANDNSPDAPNLTPGWGSADTLWIWVAVWDNATRTMSAYPTNYGSNQNTNTGAGTSATTAIAVASRELAASSENPGSVTLSTSEQWNAWTIAVKPTGGGSTPIAFAGTIPTLNGTEGSAFSEDVSSYFSGSETPFAYTVQSGTLPTGLSLSSSTGVISGTPTTAGTSSGIVIRGTDATPYTADSNSFSIVIAAAPAGPTIDTQPSNQTVTAPATATFTVAATTSGGALAYQWQRNPGGVGSWANVTTGTGGTSASYTTAVTTVSGGDANDGDDWRVQVTDDNGTTTSSAATLTVNAAAADNIRLQPGLYLERGGQAASLTSDRWWVFTSDLSAVENTGTALSINSSGQPTIDINSSASYVVGDLVPLGLTVYDEGTAAASRTVRTFFGWVEAVAQS